MIEAQEHGVAEFSPIRLNFSVTPAEGIPGMSKCEVARVFAAQIEKLQPENNPIITLNGDQNQVELASGYASIILYTFVVELVIKGIWEKRYNKQAKYTHNISHMFKELSKGHKTSIINIYENCCATYLERLKLEATMMPFEESLEWNQKAIKGFKYDLCFDRLDHPPIGLFIQRECPQEQQYMIIFSEGNHNFAIELSKWASRLTQEEQPPC